MKKLETYGEPAINIAGLRIWIHNRTHPEADEYWDANWVDATVACTDRNASVTVEGPIIHLGDIERWLAELIVLNDSLSGKANLECIEPNFAAYIACDKLGHLSMRVDIRPEQMAEQHSFSMHFDQTYLTGLIGDCQKLLAEYPVRYPLGQESA